MSKICKKFLLHMIKNKFMAEIPVIFLWARLLYYNFQTLMPKGNFLFWSCSLQNHCKRKSCIFSVSVQDKSLSLLLIWELLGFAKQFSIWPPSDEIYDNNCVTLFWSQPQCQCHNFMHDYNQTEQGVKLSLGPLTQRKTEHVKEGDLVCRPS